MNTERLNIVISKTKLNGITITLPSKEGDVPSFGINLSLCTEYGHDVTQVAFNSGYTWDKKQAFDVPARAYELAHELGAILHKIGQQKVQNFAAMLDAPKAETDVIETAPF